VGQPGRVAYGHVIFRQKADDNRLGAGFDCAPDELDILQQAVSADPEIVDALADQGFQLTRPTGLAGNVETIGEGIADRCDFREIVRIGFRIAKTGAIDPCQIGVHAIEQLIVEHPIAIRGMDREAGKVPQRRLAECQSCSQGERHKQRVEEQGSDFACRERKEIGHQ